MDSAEPRGRVAVARRVVVRLPEGTRLVDPWQRRLANARLEMSPGGGHDLLAPLWSRILSFVAPRATGRA